MIVENIIPLLGAGSGFCVGGFFGFWVRGRRAGLVVFAIFGFLTASIAASHLGIFQRPEPSTLQIAAAWFFAIFGLPLLALVFRLILVCGRLGVLAGVCSFMSAFGYLWRNLGNFGDSAEARMVRWFRNAHGQNPTNAPHFCARVTEADGEWLHPQAAGSDRGALPAVRAMRRLRH